MTEETETAQNDNQVTRLRHYARGERGGAVSLDVARSEGAVVVSWNANKGNGWYGRGWRKTFRGSDAETQAMDFAKKGWGNQVAWLEKLEPEQGSGAAGAFSAQVAAMH